MIEFTELWNEKYANGITRKDIVLEVVPKIIQTLKDNNLLEDSIDGVQSMNGAFIICTKDTIFSVYSDFSVFNHPQFATCGSCTEIANGAYEALEYNDGLTNLQKAMIAGMSTIELDTGTSYPLKCVDVTEWHEFEFYSKKDILNQLKVW